MDQNDIADRYEAWKDTMTEPSKTPRTDAVVIAGEHEERGLEEYVPASFARELELSLSDASSKLAEIGKWATSARRSNSRDITDWKDDMLTIENIVERGPK